MPMSDVVAVGRNIVIIRMSNFFAFIEIFLAIVLFVHNSACINNSRVATTKVNGFLF